MDHIEIDHIEVTDLTIGIKYWTSQCQDAQNIIFHLTDYENWLKSKRRISLGKYWDHWDEAVDEMAIAVFHQDIKQYLTEKIGQLSGNQLVERLPRKPMSRVSSTGRKGTAESESA